VWVLILGVVGVGGAVPDPLPEPKSEGAVGEHKSGYRVLAVKKVHVGKA